MFIVWFGVFVGLLANSVSGWLSCKERPSGLFEASAGVQVYCNGNDAVLLQKAQPASQCPTYDFANGLTPSLCGYVTESVARGLAQLSTSSSFMSKVELSSAREAAPSTLCEPLTRGNTKAAAGQARGSGNGIRKTVTASKSLLMHRGQTCFTAVVWRPLCTGCPMKCTTAVTFDQAVTFRRIPLHIWE